MLKNVESSGATRPNQAGLAISNGRDTARMPQETSAGAQMFLRACQSEDRRKLRSLMVIRKATQRNSGLLAQSWLTAWCATSARASCLKQDGEEDEEEIAKDQKEQNKLEEIMLREADEKLHNQ